MIRLASIQNANAISKNGIRQLVKTRLVSPSSSLLITRSFADDAAEKPKGIPYSKLTVGVPKETFPLEKRVAATPEVSTYLCVYDMICVHCEIYPHKYIQTNSSLLKTYILYSN